MAGRILQLKAKILYNDAVADKYYKIGLLDRRIADASNPGQFVMVKVAQGTQPILRRPFGVHKVRGKALEILYEVLGEGTRILSHRKAGEYLDVLGPLGNGFDYLTPNTYNLKPILIAGGMGVAPLVFLAEKLKSHHVTKSPRHTTTVLIGAKTKSQILCEREFKKLGCAVKIATDDGSKGFKGYVTDLLKKELASSRYPLSAIYACGPRPMLQAISRISQKHKIPAQVSLEEHMACGIGACLGCVVKVNPSTALGARKSKVKTGFEYKRVCKEGPVFYADRIIWEDE